MFVKFKFTDVCSRFHPAVVNVSDHYVKQY